MIGIKILELKLNSIEQKLSELLAGHDQFVNVDEAAVLLGGISKSAVYKLSSEKKLATYKPGGKIVLFKKSDLLNYIESSRTGSADEIRSQLEGN